jgi:uroporphyrinogen-III synthase
MKPLAGKTVMITRPERQSGGLRDQLEALGAEVAGVPVVDIAPPSDLAPLDSALKALESFDWLVLTSVNGVEAVRSRLGALGLTGVPQSLKIATIGPATAAACAEHLKAPDLTPKEFLSEAIAEALPSIDGQSFLLARADLARRDLAEILANRGGKVTEVTAYRIVRNTEAKLPDVRPDAITFTSAEVARATFDLLKAQGKESWLSTSALFCIGPITAAAIQGLGYQSAAVATEYDNHGLVTALVGFFDKETANA